MSVEVLNSGLLALDEARTPLGTNLLQLDMRALLLSLLISWLGVQALPLALASTALLEALTLGLVFWRKFADLSKQCCMNSVPACQPAPCGPGTDAYRERVRSAFLVGHLNEKQSLLLEINLEKLCFSLQPQYSEVKG